MFTGLIQSLGEVEKFESIADGLKLTLRKPDSFAKSLKKGDSLAINGCCLTVVNDPSTNLLEFELSPETLKLSSLGGLIIGDTVNLETCVEPHTPMGGHFVTGHVDALGEVVSIERLGSFTRVTIEIPASFLKLVVSKGSIAVDGVSLTVNDLLPQNRISLMIIPHTWDHTIFARYQVGQKVNLEFDILAKYVESMLAKSHSQEGNSSVLVRQHS